MYTEDAKVVIEKDIFVNIPMTKPSGKVRIKRRSFFALYGEPVAPRQHKMSQENYIEWQIGYDLLANEENKKKTTIIEKTFINYKKEKKYCYELSEILYYSKQRKIISEEEIQMAYREIRNISPEKTFEETATISRTNPKEVKINGMDFYSMNVSYPLFVHRFGQYEIFAEIMIREKQKAMGTQAMLYVCIPVTALQFQTNVLGRIIESKECAKWIIGREEALLVLEMFRVFGMLSSKHRFDVLSIFEMLFPFVKV
jgi:hypothetical protein